MLWVKIDLGLLKMYKIRFVFFTFIPLKTQRMVLKFLPNYCIINIMVAKKFETLNPLRAKSFYTDLFAKQLRKEGGKANGCC